MIDVDAVKARNDLAAVVEACLGAPQRKSGCRLYWLCPWHDDHNPSLEVNTQQQRWYCPPCQLSGDVIAWVMRWENVDFLEACKRLGAEYLSEVRARPKPRPGKHRAEPTRPSETWQERARGFITYAQEQLWREAGRAALAHLRQERGLRDETIRSWGLGWNPKDWWDKPERWGLGGNKRIWLPRGVVIPCEVDGAVWYVKVRRFGDDGQPLMGSGEKYGSPRGGRSALFGLDKLQGRDMVIICEGEFDAMLLWQEIDKVGHPVDVLAVGGAGRHLEDRWLSYLTTFKRLVVAFDLDDAGQSANARWLGESARVRRACIPKLSDKDNYDLTDFWKDGGRLHDWAEYHLVKFYELEQGSSLQEQGPDEGEPSDASERITLLWPEGAKVATIGGQWRRLETGEIEATYTRDQLRLCLAVMRGATDGCGEPVAGADSGA